MYDFIIKFMHKATLKMGSSQLNQKIKDKSEILKYENLIYESLKVDYKEIEVFNASKQLSFDANNVNIELGIKIHEILEMSDFHNPDFKSIDSNFQKYLKNLLEHPILGDLKEGKIYKEYQFFDDNTKIRGIIDLLIVYKDYIKIIDYKLKNIEAKEYEKQLKSYQKYIEKAFNKPVYTYLYSLIDNQIKEIK